MAGRSPYADLSVGEWRQLLAQAVLLDMAADSLSELHDGSLTSVTIRTAIDHLIVAASVAGARASNDADAVNQACVLWFDELDRLVDTPAIKSREKQLLANLRARQVTDTSDPYGRLFLIVTQQAAAVYGDCWPQAHLSLSALPKAPRAALGVDPYGIYGRTLPGQSPTVELMIHAPAFGPAAYAALPSVLVHECVCHVPARQRSTVDNESPFAEGFMDWAARFFFRQWIREMHLGLTAAALEHASTFDQFVTRPETAEGAARRRGRRAGDRIVDWLVSSRRRSVLEAEPWVARLAVELNCVDAPLTIKDRFVIRLNRSPWAPDLAARMANVLESRTPAKNLL
jgi:hypothetical protein